MPQQRLDVHQFGQTYYRTEPKSALSIRFITASTVIEPSVIVAPSRDVTERGSATPAGRGAGRAAVPGARPRGGRGLAAGHCERLAARPVVRADPDAWAAYLRRNLVDSRRAVALTTEGALIGSLAAPGFNLEIGLVSDDAGQFGLFVHGLFWVHAERPLSHLVPLNASDRRAIAWVRRQVWFLYWDLKAYRQHPDPEAKDRITRRLRGAVRHGNHLRTAQSGASRIPAQPGRVAPGAGTPRLADPQQPQRTRSAGQGQETPDQRRDPQRGRASVPRHLRQPQEDLPQTGRLLLGVPQRSGGRPERDPVARGVDSPARYGLNQPPLQLMSI